ncbi:MAG: glutamine synthetase family protein [Acidimicrobiia bacterium]
MARLEDISVGKVDFVERNGLWTDEQQEAAQRVQAQIEERELTTVRVSWGDQHGIVRGKTLTTHDFFHAMRNGIDFQTATLYMDTTNNLFAPMFSSRGGLDMEELAGGPDSILVPDPTTFRVLPWTPKTGWVLSDMYFSNGSLVPFDTRGLLRRVLADLQSQDYEYISGLEVEWYITKLEDAMLQPHQVGWPPDPPKVSAVAHGFQYLTEHRNDEIDPILQVLLDNLTALGLPLRTMEDEWGPGQCEFTFDPVRGLESADNMLLFRTAAKQICRRNGYHATFMTRPGLPNFFSSGWHLHQSLRSIKEGANSFTNRAKNGEPLSAMGKFFVGGLLKHAHEASPFTTPTINGYKRFKPYSFAPDRVTWALENRAALIRVIGGPGDETAHIENRAGEPCANPYLYMASQIIAGMDGVKNKIDPGPLSESPYEADAPKMPRSLMESIAALNQSELYRRELSDRFVDYFVALKNSEINRFLDYVTDWEHREYFEIF